ncbi:MAG: UbiA-like polyprenyltransferase [Phycisphaerae bacterium]
MPSSECGSPNTDRDASSAAGLWRAARTWGEMIKLSHSVFALPFAIVAAMLAGRRLDPPGPSVGQWVLVMVCMVAARSFAMTLNRIVDARIDACNPRTAGRPIPTGRISPRQAWCFALAAATCFLLGCAGFQWIAGNPWPLRLGPIVLLYLAGYSYTKRITSLSHFVLGLAIASAPVAAWIAIQPAGVGWSALTLMFAAAAWIAGFDIIYACQDVEVDRRERLHSLPARLGIAPALWVSRGCHALTLILLASLPQVEPLGQVYSAGVIAVGLLLAWEQSLVRADDLSRVNLAFFTLNGVVGLVFAAMTIADLLLRAA